MLRSWLTWTSRAAIAGAGAATVLGFAERAWWGLGILVSFRVQQAGVLALSSAVLALTGSRRWAAAGAVGVLANAAVLAPLYAADRPPPDTADRLRVASWNVEYTNTSYRQVAEVLRGLDAEVVFLIEAYEPWEEKLAAADLGYEVQRPRGVDGLLVLTRRPAEVRPLEWPHGRQFVEVSASLGDRTVRVLGAHTRAPVGGESTAVRGEQLRAVAALTADSAEPVVVLGDLNIAPWGHDLRTAVQDGRLVDSTRGFGVQPSWPAWGWAWPLRVQIDHALHSPDLVTVERSVGASHGSDHRLLTVTLARAAS